jgi:hypothetical protein
MPPERRTARCGNPVGQWIGFASIRANAGFSPSVYEVGGAIMSGAPPNPPEGPGAPSSTGRSWGVLAIPVLAFKAVRTLIAKQRKGALQVCGCSSTSLSALYIDGGHTEAACG